MKMYHPSARTHIVPEEVEHVLQGVDECWRRGVGNVLQGVGQIKGKLLARPSAFANDDGMLGIDILEGRQVKIGAENWLRYRESITHFNKCLTWDSIFIAHVYG